MSNWGKIKLLIHLCIDLPRDFRGWGLLKSEALLSSDSNQWIGYFWGISAPRRLYVYGKGISTAENSRVALMCILSTNLSTNLANFPLHLWSSNPALSPLTVLPHFYYAFLIFMLTFYFFSPLI